VGIAIDIDEQKQAMTLLDALFSQAPVGLAYLDREGCYKRINETLAAFNGLAVEAHAGRHPAEVVPSLWPRIAPAIQQALEQGEPVLNQEISGETVATRGETHHWLVNYYPVRTGPRSPGLAWWRSMRPNAAGWSSSWPGWPRSAAACSPRWFTGRSASVAPSRPTSMRTRFRCSPRCA
jgi:PAS domain S-box-containing protein